MRSGPVGRKIDGQLALPGIAGMDDLEHLQPVEAEPFVRLAVAHHLRARGRRFGGVAVRVLQKRLAKDDALRNVDLESRRLEEAAVAAEREGKRQWRAGKAGERFLGKPRPVLVGARGQRPDLERNLVFVAGRLRDRLHAREPHGPAGKRQHPKGGRGGVRGRVERPGERRPRLCLRAARRLLAEARAIGAEELHRGRDFRAALACRARTDRPLHASWQPRLHLRLRAKLQRARHVAQHDAGPLAIVALGHRLHFGKRLKPLVEFRPPALDERRGAGRCQRHRRREKGNRSAAPVFACFVWLQHALAFLERMSPIQCEQL